MDTYSFILSVVTYVSAAVISVTLFARLGLGSVLGYLVAGIAIGPWGLRYIDNAEDVLHFSELGVVLLLFLIGLELDPRKLWSMRKPIVIAGGLQELMTALLLGAVMLLLGLPWQTALIAGLGLSLSSTAIALQTLKERRLLQAPLGKTGFSILLLQDVSVIPILVLIPIVAIGAPGLPGDSAPAVTGLIVVAVFISIFVVGRYTLRHIFRFVAATHLPEIFTALSLLLVCGIGAIMHQIGVSMALGAFLGGVILADSEYRHALESDIQPFKGLLLGLFFISVGMTIDFGLLFENPLIILAATLALICLKAVVLYIIAWLFRLDVSQRPLFAFILCQSGEFAFVLFGFAAATGSMDGALASQLILIVAMSMVTTPLLLLLHDRCIEPRFARAMEREMDDIQEENQVILVGFGRFGQVIGRMLLANNIVPTVIENDPDHIERVRRYGYKTYYGDIFRRDVLHSIGARNASLIILTADGTEEINLAVDLIQREFPDLSIIARAHDRDHAMHLIGKQVAGVTRETFFSAVEMGKLTLRHLGFPADRIETIATTYVRHDIEVLNRQVESPGDEDTLVSIAKHARQQLEQTLRADQMDSTERKTGAGPD